MNVEETGDSSLVREQAEALYEVLNRAIETFGREAAEVKIALSSEGAMLALSSCLADFIATNASRANRRLMLTAADRALRQMVTAKLTSATARRKHDG